MTMQIEWPPTFCPECQAILDEVTARICPPGVSMLDRIQFLGGLVDELRERRRQELIDNMERAERQFAEWSKREMVIQQDVRR